MERRFRKAKFPLARISLRLQETGYLALVILRTRVGSLKRRSLEGFVRRVRRVLELNGSVNVLVTSSAEVRALNRRFRAKNKATDVLSFPAQSPKTGANRLAGDIAISADVAMRNAASLGHSAAEEVKILTLHGILHLSGLDHERDNGRMARKEMVLRRRFRLPTGLIERAEPAAASKADRAKARRAK
jgi:probable rRNA maturation factor